MLARAVLNGASGQIRNMATVGGNLLQLTGTGAAASTYPARRQPSRATATAREGGFVVRIAAADIGTGARTVLTQIAAETLGTSPDRVRVELGDSDLPRAWLGRRVDEHRELGLGGGEGVRGPAEERKLAWAAPTPPRTWPPIPASPGTRSERSSRRSAWTPIPGRCGWRACSACSPPGGSSTPTLARSQLIGGMTMGLGMALMEQTVVDQARAASSGGTWRSTTSRPALTSRTSTRRG